MNPGRMLPWVFTVDVDLDVFDVSIGAAGGSSGTWRALEEGVPVVREVLSTFPRAGLHVTWFVRVDDQVGALFEDPAFALRHLHETWHEVTAAGDEVGVHPHLYRQEGESWGQELDDEALKAQVKRAVVSMRDVGFPASSSRIGDAFHHAAVMEALTEVGVEVDSTAMPGRRRIDGSRRIDWVGTPRGPYFPSRSDYRRPGDDCWTILEVPMTMVEVAAPYDERPLERYVDLSFREEILQPRLERVVGDVDGLVTILHAFGEDPTRAPHDLLSFRPDTVRNNIEFVLESADRQDRPVRGMTLGDYGTWLRDEGRVHPR